MAVLFFRCLVPVQMFMHQVAGNQQIVIREDLVRRTLRHVDSGVTAGVSIIIGAVAVIAFSSVVAGLAIKSR